MKQSDRSPEHYGHSSSNNLLELQQGIIYGPIQSRRLGSSLGVNLLPTKTKICSFDCVYCQYGWTDLKVEQCDDTATMKMPSAADVLSAVEHALVSTKSANNLPDHITFAGNGEPTLHPEFSAIVEGTDRIRKSIAPDVKLSILSNSSRAHEPGIREALSRLDFRYMKFDCGSAAVFQRYNRPHNPLGLHLIIEGLRLLVGQADVVIQSLFCGGEAGNLTFGNVAQWVRHISVIRPKEVHLYSLDRGYPQSGLEKSSAKELEKIAALLEPFSISTAIF